MVLSCVQNLHQRGNVNLAYELYTQANNSSGYYMPMVIFKEIKLLGNITNFTIFFLIDLLAGVVYPKKTLVVVAPSLLSISFLSEASAFITECRQTVYMIRAGFV